MSLTREQKLQVARDKGLKNVEIMAQVADEVGLPLYVMFAWMTMESKGANVYGHDSGGMLSGYPYPVNQDNYKAFRYMVINKGFPSNGVGPAQITYRGYFLAMEGEGLKPWDIHDNMFFGARLLKSYKTPLGSWKTAGTKYNGKSSYGDEFAKRVTAWKIYLKIGT